LDSVRDYLAELTTERKNQSEFTGARDSEWQWQKLGHMQIYTFIQTHSHASIPPSSFLQAGCPSCCPTNSSKALKAIHNTHTHTQPFYCSSVICPGPPGEQVPEGKTRKVITNLKAIHK